MKFINIFCVLILLFFNSCKLPTVGYFITQPFIKAYETKFDNNMTIVFDETISDTLIIKSPGIKKMTVLSFRHSIEDALKNTFKNSCVEVMISNSFNKKGFSLVFVKLKPDWNKKSSKTIVSGGAGNVRSSTIYELETKISYEAILYLDGRKLGVLDGIVFSEKSSFKPRETPDVFKDGIKKMCEDVYKKTVVLK
jgi:hypothetical protein